MTEAFSRIFQIVIDTSLDNFDKVSKLPISSSIIVEGKLVETPSSQTTFLKFKHQK